jgi:hypothetical protein
VHVSIENQQTCNQLLLFPKLRITFRIYDAETLSQTWLSGVGLAWLFFQAKLNGNFLLYVVLVTHFKKSLF